LIQINFYLMDYKNFNLYKGLSRIIEIFFWLAVVFSIFVFIVIFNDGGIKMVWFPIIIIGIAYIVKLILYYILDGFANKN
tara:strand:- start:595 stop:834 length:240 start_codon:yes stop_codon:yes gene_type:complete